MESLSSLYPIKYTSTTTNDEDSSDSSLDKLLNNQFASDETRARINRLKELEKIRKQGFGQLPPRILPGSIKSSRTEKSVSLSSSQDGLNGIGNGSGVGISDRYGISNRDRSGLSSSVLNHGYSSTQLDRSTGARQKNFSTSSYTSGSLYSNDKENRYSYRKGSASSAIPNETPDSYLPSLQRSQSLNAVTATDSYENVDPYQSQYNQTDNSYEDDDNIEDFKRSLFGDIDALNKTTDSYNSFQGFSTLQPFAFDTQNEDTGPFSSSFNGDRTEYISYLGKRPFGSSAPPTTRNLQRPEESSSFHSRFDERFSNGDVFGDRHYQSTTNSSENFLDRDRYDFRNNQLSQNYETKARSKAFSIEDALGTTAPADKAAENTEDVTVVIATENNTEELDNNEEFQNSNEDVQVEDILNEDIPSEEKDDVSVRDEKHLTEEKTVDSEVHNSSKSEDVNNAEDDEDVDKALDNEDVSSQMSNSGSYSEAPSESQKEDLQTQESDNQTSDKVTNQQITDEVGNENVEESEQTSPPPQSPSKLRSFFGAIFHPFDRSSPKKEKVKKENKQKKTKAVEEKKTSPVSSEGRDYLSASDYETASDEEKEEVVVEEFIITSPHILEEVEGRNDTENELENDDDAETLSNDSSKINNDVNTRVDTSIIHDSNQINESVQKPLSVATLDQQENIMRKDDSAWIENNISPQSRTRKIGSEITMETECIGFQKSKKSGQIKEDDSAWIENNISPRSRTWKIGSEIATETESIDLKKSRRSGQTQTSTESSSSSSSTSISVQTLPVKVDKATQTDDPPMVACTEKAVQASSTKMDFSSQVDTQVSSTSMNVNIDHLANQKKHVDVIQSSTKSPDTEPSKSNVVVKGNDHSITKPFMIVDLSAKKEPASHDKEQSEADIQENSEEFVLDNDKNDEDSLLMAEPYKTAHENAKPKFITPIMEVKSPKANGSPFNSNSEFTFSIGGTKTANGDVHKPNSKTRFKRPPALLPKSKNSSNGRRTPTSPSPPTTTSSRSSSLSSVELSPIGSPRPGYSRKKSEVTYDDQGREIVQDPIKALKDNPFIRNDSKVRKVTYGSFSKRCEESMGKSRKTPPTTPRGASSRKDSSAENGEDSKRNKSGPLSPRVKPQVTTRIVNKIISSAEKVQSKVTGLTSKSDNSTNEEDVNASPSDQESLDLTPNHLKDIFEYADADEPVGSDNTSSGRLSVAKSEISDESSRASSPRDTTEDKKSSTGKKGTPTKNTYERSGTKSPRAKSPFPDNLREYPLSVDTKRRNSTKSSPPKDDKTKSSSLEGKIVRPCNREENGMTVEGKKVPPPKAPKPKKGTFAFLRGKKVNK